MKRYGVVEELIRAEMEEEQANVRLGNSVLCIVIITCMNIEYTIHVDNISIHHTGSGWPV